MTDVKLFTIFCTKDDIRKAIRYEIQEAEKIGHQIITVQILSQETDIREAVYKIEGMIVFRTLEYDV